MPMSAVSLFLTVDISETATTLLWFDLWVLNVYGLLTPSSLVFGDIHDEYQLVRIWNVSGGRADITTLAINEVYPWPNGIGGDTDEWVELINPTAGNINLNGYYLYYYKNKNKQGTIYTFGASDSINGDNTIQAYTTGTDEIPRGAYVRLYDGSDTLIDEVYVNGVLKGRSLARYRDAELDPQDVWYTDLTPSQGSDNDLIPEFKDIVYPVVGTLVAFAIIRRRAMPLGKGRRNSQE
jgi:hypothetical protein